MRYLAFLPVLALVLAACDKSPMEIRQSGPVLGAPLFTSIPVAACPDGQTLVEANGFESDDKNGDGWICVSTNGAGKVLYGDNNVNSSPGERPIDQLPPEAANGVLHSCLGPEAQSLLPVQPGDNCSALCQDVAASACTQEDCTQLCVVAGGAISPWSGHLFAHPHFGGGGSPFGIAIFDIDDITNIQRVHDVPNIQGWTVAVDKSGNVYVGRRRNASEGGLDVYDSGFNLISQTTIPPSDAGGIMTVLEGLAVGPSGLLFVCNAARAPESRLFVFDIADPTDPVLLNIEVIPGPISPSGNGCFAPAFDANGDVWVAGIGGGGGFTRMAFDAAGDLLNWDWYQVNSHYLAFEPTTDRLFAGVINFNFIKVIEPADRSTVVANIQNVCDEAMGSPGYLAFTAAGDLIVGCSNFNDVPTDLVVFTSASLSTVTTGTVNAADLNPIRFADPLIWGAGAFAIAP